MDRLFQSVLQPTATTGARLPATVAPAPNPTPGPSPTPLIKDYTASDLLDIGSLVCPPVQAPSAHNLTVVGQYWRDAVCVKCQCPGLGLDCQ